MAEDRSEREEEPTLEGGLAPYSLPPSQERRYSYFMWCYVRLRYNDFGAKFRYYLELLSSPAGRGGVPACMWHHTFDAGVAE